MPIVIIVTALASFWSLDRPPAAGGDCLAIRYMWDYRDIIYRLSIS
jgi:hypothetical protein